ncbi:KGK domain-containing protein [filamentous cyanobacterium CCP2]|nr:KGK domain-containing protein [filamentous cyanobacterium CCP2]
MDNDFGMLNDDEVVFVRGDRVLMANPTFKVIEFLDALAQLVSEQEQDWTEDQEGWFTDRGAQCEVLRFGNQGWQRGRIRVRLEFCPDPPPKLLRESRSTREDSYSQDNPYAGNAYPGDAFREDRPPLRRRKREDVYRPDPNQWSSEPPIYPEIDESY